MPCTKTAKYNVLGCSDLITATGLLWHMFIVHCSLLFIALNVIRSPEIDPAPPITVAATDQTNHNLITGMCSLNRDRHMPMVTSTMPDSHRRSTAITLLVLLLSGDIQMNPGPQGQSTISSCGLCDLKVSWSHKAICCDECDMWYHKSCIELSTCGFDRLANTNVTLQITVITCFIHIVLN